MKPFVWNPEMSVEETKNGAYWERNMLALTLAHSLNGWAELAYNGEPPKSSISGWYVHGEYAGWSRVISIMGGRWTFHVPDDFDLGTLNQIEPNWDGHTTEEKWIDIMKDCGVTPTL